jgi:hypothetical protein
VLAQRAQVREITSTELVLGPAHEECIIAVGGALSVARFRACSTSCSRSNGLLIRAMSAFFESGVPLLL